MSTITHVCPHLPTIAHNVDTPKKNPQRYDKNLRSPSSPMFEDASLNARFNVVIERDADGFLVASVPQLPGCHTQAKTMDELLKRVKAAIKLYLEVEGKSLEKEAEFLGVQLVEIPLSDA